jgi:hypothetical protein
MQINFVDIMACDCDFVHIFLEWILFKKNLIPICINWLHHLISYSQIWRKVLMDEMKEKENGGKWHKMYTQAKWNIPSNNKTKG